MTELFAGSGSSLDAKNVYLGSLGDDYGEFTLGSNTSRVLVEDPKLLLFTLSRYKFVSKMMAGFGSVLEVGCQEGWGMPLIAHTVEAVHGIDFYRPYIDSCVRRFNGAFDRENMTFEAHDILDSPMARKFDGVFALDVLEHIAPSDEDRFMTNCTDSLKDDGTLILGMPSLASQKYASASSKAGHVNCKDGPEFANMAEQYFTNVFTMCMNDEVLHTGFFPMAQYLFVVCTNKSTLS